MYKRLHDQWQFYPTRVQEMLLEVTQCKIVEKGQINGKKVKYEQDKSYHVDTEEIEELAISLEGDLESIGLGGSRGSRDEEDEGSTTEEDLLVSPHATRVEPEEDGDSDQDKENEELSEDDNGTGEGDQECAHRDSLCENRLEKMAERLRDWVVENDGI